MKKAKTAIAVLCLVLVISCLSACGQKTDRTGVSTETKGSAIETVAQNSQPQSSQETHTGPVEASWFDDAVFVGDSVTLKLSYYCEDHPEALGNAKFFCAGSLGWTTALWDLDAEDAVHPYYQGENYLSQDCAKITGAKKVFIMLGMNDVALYGVEDTIKSADTLIGNILKQTPDVKIYLQSVTPIIQGKELSDLNNEVIRRFDESLKSYAEGKGYQFLDIYNYLADSNGYLPLEYCSDPEAQGIHFTDEACEKWATYLKENVK